MSESDFEPVPGLPEVLPKGERMLWQGQPHWRPLALRAFRLREVMIYFVALMAWRIVSTLWDGAGLLAALNHALSLAPFALGAVSILLVIAYFSAKTTMYTITDRRIVLRIGMALPLTLNLPFEAIEGASVANQRDGSGDIALQLRDGQRLAYLILWPHARPWRYTRPEPMLRGLAHSSAVAGLLAQALAGASNAPKRNTVDAVTTRDMRGAPAPLAM